MKTVGVIGAGAWGTALAQAMAAKECPVTLWAREADVAAAIAQHRENTPFLHGIPLHEGLTCTNDLAQAAACDALLLVTPAQHLRATLKALADSPAMGKPLVICAKGIEIGTGRLMSEVAAETMPESPVAIMTGPTFAREIAGGLPCAVTLATTDQSTGIGLVNLMGSRTFRLYYSDDVIGAQIGGAVKNVIAIACGIVWGRKMGDSARAALITRGMAEIARLAVAMGGRKETLLGMGGMGDLILTCTSMQSRNFSLGVALGEGMTLTEILNARSAVTEGVHTAKALAGMAEKYGIDMPVSEAIRACLCDDVPVADVIERMLDRPMRAEGQ